jgi:hypothetical protein
VSAGENELLHREVLQPAEQPPGSLHRQVLVHAAGLAGEVVVGRQVHHTGKPGSVLLAQAVQRLVDTVRIGQVAVYEILHIGLLMRSCNIEPGDLVNRVLGHNNRVADEALAPGDHDHRFAGMLHAVTSVVIPADATPKVDVAAIGMIAPSPRSPTESAEPYCATLTRLPPTYSNLTRLPDRPIIIQIKR